MRTRPESADRFALKLAVIALFCLAVAVFLGKAPDSTLPATDAATHAALSMNATAQGLVPALPIGAEAQGGHWGQGFNDHPFLYFYVSGWLMRFFGPDAWSAKLFPCLMSVGCVMLTFWLGALLRSAAFGLLAGFILLASREFVIDGLNAHLDNVMTVFILASFIAWRKNRVFLAGALAGMGVWFKSPVALLLFPAALFFEGLASVKSAANWKRVGLALGTALVTGFSLWFVAGALGGMDLVRDYWVRQLWGTAVGGRGGAQSWNPFQFVAILRSHYMPWSILLIVSLIWAFARKACWQVASFRVPLSAAGVLIAAVSLIRFKYDHYFVPAYPFLALLAAHAPAFWLERHAERFYRGFSVFVLALVTFLLATPVETAPESFPALRKFMALIQAHGACEDRVVIVNGGQPYGTFQDYSSLIHFYTGRHAVGTECVGLVQAASDPRAGWIVVSGANFRACVSEELRREFPAVWEYRGQFLLSRRVPAPASGGPAQVHDLSFLGRELKAATDCKAAPLPSNRYHGAAD